MMKLKGNLSEFKNIQKPECRHIIVNYDIQDDIQGKSSNVNPQTRKTTFELSYFLVA